MPNPYFHFKQFTVFHDKCAMKIGTDGVLLGAWVGVQDKHTILDVGTGTGIMAIMAAQRSMAHIDAVEIDENACLQAAENFAVCPWHDRINLIPNSFQDFARTCEKRYDLIISNPPFFRNQFRPADKQRAIARHDDALPLDELIANASALLTTNGTLAIIIPSDLFQFCERCLLAEKLYISRKLNIKPTPEKAVKRVVLEAERTVSGSTEESIAVENGTRHDYTEQYKELTRDFYLAF